MTLQEFIAANQPLSFDTMRANVAHHSLAREVQNKLSALGILDPDVERFGETDFKPKPQQDGRFGANSRAMLEVFCTKAAIPFGDALTPAIASALLASTPETFFPLHLTHQPTDSQDTIFARRILRFMQANGYWIARHPDMYNIVYVEGCDADGKPNADLDNEWNDRRILIRIRPDGHPDMTLNETAVTEPTIKYAKKQQEKHETDILEPFAARIAFGQYKAWIMGYHHRFIPSKKQPALQQTLPVLLHRDKDASGTRNRGDQMDVGVFGINQHSTRPNEFFARPGNWSEGCLVGRDFARHLDFLQFLKNDIRYQKNEKYAFMTVVINGTRLQQEQPQ